MKGQFTLPINWRWVALGDVCAIERGITFPSNAQVNTPSENHIACLRTTNVQERVNWESLIYIPHSYVQGESKYIHKNDILISIANSRELVGKVSFVDKVEVEATFGGFISVIRVSEQIDAFYLFSYLRADSTQEKLRGSSNQTTNIANLTAKEIARLPIPLPPLQEQRQIANILRQVDLLQIWRKESISKAKILKDSLFREIIGNSAINKNGWAVKKVKEVGSVVLGRQRAPKYQTGQFTRPYLRVANVFEDRLDLSDVLSMDFDDRDFFRYKLESGDILLNEGQSTELVGRPAMWHDEIPDCCFQNTLIRFRSDKSIVEPEYALGLFLHYFKTGEFAKISSKTSSVAHLGVSRFAEMEFILPPLSVQREYVHSVQKAQSVLDDQTKSLEYLVLLLKSLVIRAYKGDLTTTWREKHMSEFQNTIVEQEDIDKPKLEENLSGRKEEPTVPDESRYESEFDSLILNLVQRKALNLIQDAGDYFSPESLSEASDLPLEEVRNALVLFNALGLVVQISIADEANSTPDFTVFAPTYRAVRSTDESRDDDLSALEPNLEELNR